LLLRRRPTSALSHSYEAANYAIDERHIPVSS